MSVSQHARPGLTGRPVRAPEQEQPHEVVALLAAHIARARAGTGGLVVLRGATGTGRTTALEAARARAAADGLRVLHVRCSPRDAGAPFAVARRLLGLPPDAAGDGGEHERDEELWRALRAAAGSEGLLVAVDDVHRADAPSHRWLVELARHLDNLPAPVLLVVAERTQYDVDPPRPGFAHTLPPALVHTCTLPPLTEETAAALIRARLPDVPPSWAEECARAAAGSPLLLRALLDDLGAPDGQQPVPATTAALYPGAYPAAVSWWLDSAGRVTTQVARTLAVLDEDWDGTVLVPAQRSGEPQPPVPGDPAEPAALLARVTGAAPARIAGWLTAMTGLGWLRQDHAGRPRYAHPLLRDAVLAGVPETWRHATRRAVAESMLHHGAGTSAIARQLLPTGPVGADWAPDVLHDAAHHALSEGRREDAAAFLRRALAEPLPDGRRLRLLTELGSLEAAREDSAAGIPRLTEALRLPGDPRERVRAAFALGTVLAARGRARAAVDALRTVYDQLTDRPDLVGALRTASVLLADGDQELRRDVYRLLRDAAARTPELVGPAARVLLVRHGAAAGLVSADDAMRQVRQVLAEPADPLTEPFLLGTAAAVAQWADELDEADRLVERGLAAQRPGLLHPMHEAMLHTRADIAAARAGHGRLPAEIPESREVPPGTCAGTPGNLHAHTLLALVEQGRPDEARRFADGFDLRDAPPSGELNRFLYARGVQRASIGDHTGALHDFLECGRRQAAREVNSPVVTPWRSAAAESRIALGHHREALALAEEELRLARVWGTPRTVGRALRVLGTATGGRRGLELAEEAVRLLRDAPAGAAGELVAALLAQGRQLTAAGERARARACLREAAERAEQAGAVRLLTLVEEALREAGARRPAAARTGAASLTDSERRIARLAAEGRTNTEIADLLHLARRTVETHLTSTYRKLGIGRRGELRRALGQDAP
ncbi:helix-turn-helix transcriptional regulator [Streptomyces thermodiastaticus]|uniref:helix-turn-helix transcriptional regulator n=1 Tax=Streptomyces thermodiastaticus TaxID=44061 RepID=UPI001679F951|nr:LuxR family transcriptional regulator [Streptomyces thermodiastaticus]MCE7553131.1 LuxR family transcriptional regulator [Streptomyces thermodiastaticus]GHF92987.1 hypothetical protein GCM10018787_47210 [Streptomyces thermodiastaticus]